MDGINRWAQVSLRRGHMKIHAWHDTEVPPIGGSKPGEPGRPGIRLLGSPHGPGPAIHTLDITGTAVQAMLEGFLRTGIGVGAIIGWERRGYGVRRRDTVTLRRG